MNEKEEITCKGCQRAFPLLFSHLSRTSCKKAYGEEFEKMKILKTGKRKEYLKKYKAKWESERSDDRNEKQQKRRNQNRKETNEKQKVYRKKRKMNMTMTDRIQTFKRNIIEGPNYTCFSCKRTLFKRSVKILNINDIKMVKCLSAQ